LFLLLGDENAEAAALSAFTAYDSTNPNVILSVSSKNDGNGLYERLSEYLGLNTGSTPSVLYLNAELKKYRYVGEEISAESLASFVERVTRGEIEPFLKSAAAPETNDAPVKVVVGNSFRELILDSPKEVLVEFYAPWCGHCKQLAPHFDAAAKKLASNPNILLAKVDSSEN
jgi:thiol-disulfide isomerase/thioredoxin